MANVQLQRTLASETVSKNAIDQAQSLAVVQTMLHGGLSSLAYFRNFFSEDVFDIQTYAMGQTILPYEDFAAGNLPGIEHSTTAVTNVPILRRSCSKRVDILLDWLEKGVFVALKDGSLHALEAYVHPDAAQRDCVLETYTFTVKYGADSEGGRKLAGLQMGRQGETPVLVGTTNHALQTFLRQIAASCGQLPQLPDEKFLSMEVFYNRENTKSYGKNDWISGVSEHKYFAKAQGWARETQKLDRVASGFHHTSFSISHLQDLSKDFQYDPKVNQPPPVPQLLDFTEPYSKHDSVDPNQDRSRDAAANTSAQIRRKSSTTVWPRAVEHADEGHRTSSTAEKGQSPAEMIIRPVHTYDLPMHTAIVRKQIARSADHHDSNLTLTRSRTRLMSQEEDSINTQSSNVNMMRAALGDMMQPENFTQGETQSQPLTQNQPTCAVGDGRPVLLQAVAERLDNAKERVRPMARSLAINQGSRQDKNHLGYCQCGVGEDEGDMILCAFCDTWQHLHCYGYFGSNDPRIPETHACYRCLLSHDADPRLWTLQQLAHKRRGMYLAMDNGLKDITKFASDLRLHASSAKPVYDYLRTEGYVVQAKASRKRKSSTPRLIAVKDGPSHEKMLKDLYNPMTHISQFYEISTSHGSQPETETQRLAATEPETMPPPITPASHLRGKRHTEPPGSALDLRASMTPYKTPSRRSSRLALSQKREREAEDEDAGSSSTIRRSRGPGFGRLRAAQTATVLLVNGLPSSPAPQ